MNLNFGFLLLNRIFDFRRALVFLFLFVGCCISRGFRIYIPELSLSISLDFVLLFLTGFFLGPWIGAFNGFVIDIVFSPLFSETYSFLFLIQSVLMGFSGGIRWIIKNWNEKSYFWIFLSIVFGSSFIYLFLFPGEQDLIIAYGLLFLMMWFFITLKGSKTNLMPLISLAFFVYIVSFGIGVLGASSINSLQTPSFFFKTRALKNLVYFLFILPCFYLNLLGSRYRLCSL